ncbi:glycosyltransferase family 4 protein [Kribbella kalugense]|uniref:Glycosyltransferase involved in cell wall biosynthesis n=1 Tax=Kribbella kalugense TaxID=2512221 RepID=A0A4R8A185_9ACTN|nr:glycosyltransferase family 4 protein [Kribbella kalugense]TDW21870.1 glycosyltransferase involved in cell wall biosynthesis [Kribbella kalugense]
MRIALVSDCYLPRLGGIELQVHDLAVQLIRAGHDVTVFTVTDGPSADIPVVRLPAIAGVPLAGAIDRLRVELESFDVVHAHSSLLSPLAWHAARLARAAVITVHSLPGPTMPWPIAQIDRYAGNVGWTAVSEAVANVVRRALPGRTVDVLHNGVDPRAWRPVGRADHPLTIVSTMRLSRRKRPIALLHTLAMIRDLVPADVCLRAVIVGAGPRERAVEARRRALAPWVELPGRLSRYEIQQLYASADLYLAPAELESFGVAALEARCAGLPVVAMASGGVGEFVRPGIEGYLVESDTEMARTVAELLSDTDVLTRIQQHNRLTDPLMTWDHVIARHLVTYATRIAFADGSTGRVKDAVRTGYLIDTGPGAGGRQGNSFDGDGMAVRRRWR